ncbi:NAD(P)-binding protein [Holophaga foetida]|uniref:NAD(P)-binding protein n=1 Tax=Holophaga foetida TaxID=35839 RepID=UPI0002471C91|nr:NAD(P)-binding protein [Holophaga foetida]
MDHLSSHKRIKVNVNHREIQVYSDLTILQALLQENLHIPHLCYDIRLERSIGNCGLCVVEVVEGEVIREVKACQTPIREGMVIHTQNPKLESYRKVRLQQILADHNADCVAPCVQTCPAGIDIQKYLRHASHGNFENALRVIKDRNPFPQACGRVCPHPCETQCRRNLVDTPVAINHVKRFIADWDISRDTAWLPEKEAPTGKRIAIVGGGPSGLSAAYYSAINGHEVTVFERQPEAGGMMRYGIPEYRLPKVTLDAEINHIQKLGVRLETGRSLGTHLRLEELRNNFDAVFLAIGSWRATSMNLEGENQDGVWQGINFLAAVTKRAPVHLGETVVVVGGGNTAIDCARVAQRMGAKKVQLLYRRTQEEMPAEPMEIEEALHEGVEMLFLTAPQAITAAHGRKQVLCLKMQLGEPDRSGRRRPIPIEGSDFSLEADTIIGAIGQSTDTQFLFNDLPVKLNPWGDIEINGKTSQTSETGVFAGGDCVTGPATVIQAVAAGRRAAEAMDDLLRHGYVREGSVDYSCSRGSLEDLPRWEMEAFPRLERHPMPALPVYARLRSFAEVELGFDEESAVAEARRCMKCGCHERYDCALRKEASAHEIVFTAPLHERPRLEITEDHPFIVRDHNKCIACGRCIAVCQQVEGPDVLAFHAREGRQIVATRNGLPLKDTDCVSCGQCVNACPCGALIAKSEKESVFRAINNQNLTTVAFVAPAVRSVISAEFGIPFDQASNFMSGLLKKLGFGKVFDFSFAADLTIMEETTEFLDRVSSGGVLPQFTSCCPGWVNFVERRYPDLIPHLSSCKSPQMMMGATVKNHFASTSRADRRNLFVVSIVPCIAKKHEAARPEFAPDGIRDVDAVLTSTEILEMLYLKRIDPSTIPMVPFDPPYQQVSGAGVLFGASGGVAEAALRLAVEKLTGQARCTQLDFEEIRGFEGLKEATIETQDSRVRVAVVSGLHNAARLAEEIAQGQETGYDLIEVMACPGGCICGAGHPVPEKVGTLNDRQQVLVDIDKTSSHRKSQENPDIHRLYDEFFGEPNSPLAHKLLHTHYSPFREEGTRRG